MRLDDLMDAIGKIDLRFVKEAEDASDYGNEEKEQASPKKLFKFVRRNRILTAAACLAIILVGGSSAFLLTFRCGSSQKSADMTGAVEEAKNGAYEENAAENNAADASSPDGGADTGGGQTDTEGVAESDEALAEEIHINEIDQVIGTAICMAQPSGIKELTVEEAEAYYGVRLMPQTIPEGLSYDDTQPIQVGYTSDGTVMDDNNTLRFLDEDETARIKISARTTNSGTITEFASDSLETSVIGDTTLTIGYDASGDGYYLAIYEKAGTTVTVEGTGIGEGEMLTVLRALLAE